MSLTARLTISIATVKATPPATTLPIIAVVIVRCGLVVAVLCVQALYIPVPDLQLHMAHTVW